MSYQNNANILVAVRRETTEGVAATVTGAMQMRLIDSPGMTHSQAQIVSQEKRTDMVVNMPRLGYVSEAGTFNTEGTVGGVTDSFIEALMRSTWTTATAIGFATMTTVAIGTNEVVAAGGSWHTQGVKVGDIFVITGTTVSGNNSLNVRALAVTTLTISVATGTYTTLAATATGTLTVQKKVITATSPTNYTYSIEQYLRDLDLSELYLGCKVVSLKLSAKPGQMLQLNYSVLGIDRTALATGTSPYYTSPTLTTGIALIADDSVLRYNSAAATTFTGLDLDFTIAAKGEPVIGSSTTPTIFTNDITVTGSITGLRQDFSNLTLFDAETEFELSALFQEPTGTPKGFLSLFLPRVKIIGVAAPVGGGDGGQIETLQIAAGPKTAATGYDGTVASWQSSAA